MTAHYQRHRTEFGQLVKLAAEDARITRVYYQYRPKADAATRKLVKQKRALSPERWERYRVLFKKLGLAWGMKREGTALIYCASAEGMVTAGSEKGYVHSPTPLPDFGAPLDSDKVRSVRPNETVVRPLGDGWYLYYNWSD